MYTKDKKDILYLGNGVIRGFQGKSWEHIIKDIGKESGCKYEYDELKSLPFAMQVIGASKDNVDVHMQDLAKELSEIELNEELKTFIQERIFSLPIDTILTTNYTYELEKSAKSDYSNFSQNKCRKCTGKATKLENQFLLRRYNEVEYKEEKKKIWHIHGELCVPNSIVMGHYYYGRLLGAIETYLTDFIRRYQGMMQYQKDYQEKSWLDSFIMNNVYVVGFGMDFSELDFWWLLCYRKRRKKDGKIPVGEIYVYEPNLSLEKKIMLEAYDVQIMDHMKLNKKNYNEYYRKAFNDIGNRITTSKGVENNEKNFKL